MFFGVGMLLCFVGIVFSETRSSLLALAAIVILIAAKWVFGKNLQFLKKYALKIILGVILFVSLIIFVFQNNLIDTGRFSFSSHALRSLSSRLEIWSGALELIKEAPLGHGLDTFYIYFPNKAGKTFFSLEEDINLSADRIHNELLEVTFSGGMVAGLFYLFIAVYLFIFFFRSRNTLLSVLSLSLLANIFQNQFGFPDITLLVFTAFLAGGMIALTSKDFVFHFPLRRQIAIKSGLFLITAASCAVVFFYTVVKPLFSHLNYTFYKEFAPISYDLSIESLKTALYFTPQYSELWYELMFVDPSSMKRALDALEKIDGSETGNLLAWKGNYYTSIDEQKAYAYYEKTLQINPNHPNWVRAYADALYQNKRYSEALALYERYLTLIPDYWKWGDRINELSPEEKRKYEVFKKNVPYFDKLIEKIEKLRHDLSKS